MTAGFISGCPVHLQSCNPQDNDSSIKFCRTHQMAVSTAPPSSLFGTCWVFPIKGKCAAGSSYWPPLPVLTVVIAARKSGHRYSPICGARSTALSLAPRSRFCLSTTSDCLPTLYTTAPTTPGASIRSFTRSETDRPFRPICSFPSADSQAAAYNLYKTTLRPTL